jgi:hypothetical protein
MPIGFIIMQIGNSDLDAACETAIVPAFTECGLEPKRVDKHNQGGLLKSEIIKFIESADIIVADLTNERPNCYLEVGFAMGLDKFRNLILTAREDHNPDHPKRKPGDPKIHFDLSGYDVLFWKPDDLDHFRTELVKRIRRRMLIIAAEGSREADSSLDSKWFEEQEERARQGFATYGKKGFMEIRFSLSRPKPNIPQGELLSAASKSVIRTFGWPIGVVMTKAEWRPRPTADGIVAEILTGSTFDNWGLRRNGDFYLLRDLFEDTRRPEADTLFINTRIVQVTEAILYCARLYTQLRVDQSQIVHVAIGHGGLKGRKLAWVTRAGLEFEPDYVSHEDESTSEFSAALSEIEARLVELVKAVCEPLFTLFNFFQVSDDTYSNSVDNFVNGRVV